MPSIPAWTDYDSKARERTLRILSFFQEKETKEVLLSAESLDEAKGIPSYVLDTAKLTPVQSIEDVLKMALLAHDVGSIATAAPQEAK